MPLKILFRVHFVRNGAYGRQYVEFFDYWLAKQWSADPVQDHTIVVDKLDFCHSCGWKELSI